MIKPEILGQLLVMQSLVIGLPDEKSIFSFVCRGLLDIPGVSKVRYAHTTKKQAEGLTVRFPLLIGEICHGELLFSIKDQEVFAPYEDYLKNFCYMLAVILGERSQRLQNANLQSDLETRVKQRTIELHKSREQYLNLVEGTPDLITRVDTEGRLIFVNHAAENIFGLEPVECIGRPAFDFIHPDDRDTTMTAFQAWLQNVGNTFTHENRQVHVDGRHHHMVWSIRAEYAYSGPFRPPFRRDTGHCSGVNPASIPI